MNEHKRHHTCIFIHHCHSSRATQESTRSDHIIDLEVISGHVNSARVHLYTASYFSLLVFCGDVKAHINYLHIKSL